ncbi:MAG: aminopeptidase P family protein [Lentisphaeraceae bacterium]|nr:aminopeptidase P family protein [Lentisphaeraceae bacterium]
MPDKSLLAELKKRRKEFLEFIDDRIVIIVSGFEKVRNNDVYHPFRQDSTFNYFTAFPEPDSVAFFDAQSDSENYILFVRERDKFMELWNGFRFGTLGALENFQPDSAYSITQLEDVLLKKLCDRKVVLLCEDAHPLEERLETLADGLRTVEDEEEIIQKISSMRVIKSEYELEQMRKASRISIKAHHSLMNIVSNSSFEYNLHADFIQTCMNEGAGSMAYPPIVASGANATCLHYGVNDKALDKSGLVLVDAGCEIGGYAADITRTFPANGKFSPVQKDCYELVLQAQQDVLDKVMPGESLSSLHAVAVNTLTEGLVSMGIIKVSVDEAIDKKTYTDYYPHGTGHWLGLDVHDSGPGKDAKFRPGMAFTVEPGLYFQTYNDRILEEYKGIGIRIEDNVVITENGYENLTSSCVKSVADVESKVLGS